MTRSFYAHTLDGVPRGQWQPLEEHLSAVAERAAEFASDFGAADWGWVAGLWHDVGKYSRAFQDYLEMAASAEQRGKRLRGPDHSTAGAQHAVADTSPLGHLIAYAIAGHHGGLPDGRSDRSSCLEARLAKPISPWQDGLRHLPPARQIDPPPMLLEALKTRDGFGAAFFTRMLFSCLVDADFLDTERFMSPERAGSRPVWPDDIIGDMEASLTRHVDGLRDGSGVVGPCRTGVRRDCLVAADMPPGLFALTVPTGGGKTLSSLAFALRHAAQHGLKRVIYVVPFTSIIEQNAGVFRDVMAPLRANGIAEPVLEHHSNLEVGEDDESPASRLATENWDAPLIVTTAVQFYESLFAKRTSQCRKLHNLTRAVIILDEVQTLPVDLLAPCLRAIDQLARHYSASVVLCTATQPAIQRRDEFKIGLSGMREIVREPERLYRSLRRVAVTDLGPLTDAALADRLRASERVLCVVNTRGHARKLYDALGENTSYFHLSATMCPAHREEVLKCIRRRLDDGDGECRVVSTQLIEAGVDIDFPVVYRSLAGLDSIAQAAGRCNRNGTLGGRGQVYVFQAEHVKSERFFAETANCGRQILDLYRDDPLSVESVEHYFRLYYWEQSERWDTKSILDRFRLYPGERDFPFSLSFSSVAGDFRLIEDTGNPVIVPWGTTGRELCENLRRGSSLPARVILRRLQRYTVHVPHSVWDRNTRNIEFVHDRYPVLISPELHYSDQTGLSFAPDATDYLEA